MLGCRWQQQKKTKKIKSNRNESLFFFLSYNRNAILKAHKKNKMFTSSYSSSLQIA